GSMAIMTSTATGSSTSPRSILTPSIPSSIADSFSPKSVRSDRSGIEIVRRSKVHSISFADEVTDHSGCRQSLEFVHPVECYKDLNRLHGFGPRSTEFPAKKKSCLIGFKKFLSSLFTANDCRNSCHSGYRTSVYYA
ncbi:hypothetical protein FOL47_008590, partial [Perkinsus chesapeaki]